MDQSLREQIERVVTRYDELTAEMGQPEVAADFERLNTLAKERAGIEDIVGLYREYREQEDARDEARELVRDSDEEMAEMARAELASSEERLASLEAQLKRALLPRDPRDAKNVFVELRAGAGGDEAAIFAGDLYRMYARYAERKGWGLDIISASESERGGFKEIVFEIRGEGAYSRLKYESGVHRVQRVPETETQGRVHTSTATVAVLPEADEVDVQIDDKDLRVDIFHSSGAGGQNVNKVASAVRITHLPTNIVVACQDERSQMKNRVKAMNVLRSRLFEMEQEKADKEVAAERKMQVGSGDRSEKIRTYNFPQDRITDHRIGLTVHNIADRLDGNLDDLIDAVASADEARRLEAATL